MIKFEDTLQIIDFQEETAVDFANAKKLVQAWQRTAGRSVFMSEATRKMILDAATKRGIFIGLGAAGLVVSVAVGAALVYDHMKKKKKESKEAPSDDKGVRGSSATER